MDYLLWNDLKTMFEPHVEDAIWRNQQGYKVLEWKSVATLYRYSEHSNQGRIVGIKNLLNAATITTAHIRVNVAQLFNAAEGVNVAEGVNDASEEVSTTKLLLHGLGKYCKSFRTPWCIKGGSMA
ncbi:hypothetical protein Tco_0483436 [Tanacetum coccineum]